MRGVSPLSGPSRHAHGFCAAITLDMVPSGFFWSAVSSKVNGSSKACRPASWRSTSAMVMLCLPFWANSGQIEATVSSYLNRPWSAASANTAAASALVEL